MHWANPAHQSSRTLTTNLHMISSLRQNEHTHRHLSHTEPRVSWEVSRCHRRPLYLAILFLPCSYLLQAKQAGCRNFSSTNVCWKLTLQLIIAIGNLWTRAEWVKPSVGTAAKCPQPLRSNRIGYQVHRKHLANTNLCVLKQALKYSPSPIIPTHINECWNNGTMNSKNPFPFRPGVVKWIITPLGSLCNI